MGESLSGKCVLLVEDEYFIASDVCRALQDAGARVLGPASNLADGLALAEDGGAEFAVLDVNLEGAFSFPIADRLSARGIPSLFLTGYDEWAIPEIYRTVPRITKPHAMDAVVRLAGELSTARGHAR